MGRPRKFKRTDVEDAALAVLDRDGPGGLSMRTVADALGTGPMTLYGYIDDRSELEGLVVDAVLRGVVLPAPSADWRADATAVAEAVWIAVRAHPHAIPLILTRRSRSPRFLDIAEALLAALARGGLQDGALLVAFRAVSTLATSFALTELGGALSTSHEAPADVVARYQALPADQYPRLVEIATAAEASVPEDEFRGGIAALLAGLPRR